jgi:lysozyme
MAKYTPSQKCYDLIKHYEGCELEAYLCPAKIPTIGYGNTFYADGKPVKLGDKITKQQADELLPAIVQKFAISVANAIKTNVSQHQFDAMVSLAYNIGIGNFTKSTLLGLVNKKASDIQVANEFMKWNKSNGKILEGLNKRRKSEAELYKTGNVVYFN